MITALPGCVPKLRQLLHYPCMTWCLFDPFTAPPSGVSRASESGKKQFDMQTLKTQLHVFHGNTKCLITHVGEKLNNKRCFPVLSLHWDSVLKWLLGSLLAHSLSLNLHSPAAVVCFTPHLVTHQRLVETVPHLRCDTSVSCRQLTEM